tara:strand:- start:9102 stop:9545 length:444 start_codon:yes stop_codon:yes gene_type:complete
MTIQNHADNQALSGSNSSETANDCAEDNGDLLETITVLWLALVNHVAATIDGLRLDIKLAVTSLIALLVTVIIVAALLVGLWFLGMGLLFVGLTALKASSGTALLVIILIQLVLLYFCHRLCKQFLANLNFQATRAALTETPSQLAP